MARIGEMLGWGDNPLYKTLGSNRNAITNFGAGLASGGFGAATQGLANGAMRDDAFALMEADKATEAAQLKSTADWLNSQGYTDLVPLVEAGQGGAAMNEAFKRMQPGYGQTESNLTADMQNFQFAQSNPDFASFIGQGKQPSAPSGYSWTTEGGLSAIPGGPADPAMAANKPPTDAERKAGALTTVTGQDAALLFGNNTPEKPGIFEALGGSGDQMLQAGAFGVNPLAGFASSDYKVAKDAISNITQSYLYAMSGATAPPEEVRKIAEQVTPQPLDSPAQKKAKRDRLFAMYSAIEGAQGNFARQPQADGWVDAGNGIRIRELP